MVQSVMSIIEHKHLSLDPQGPSKHSKAQQHGAGERETGWSLELTGKESSWMGELQVQGETSSQNIHWGVTEEDNVNL